jgi:3-methyladenine DNA glycosylase AlkD
MLASDVLAKLKRLGKKKTAEIYRRHGASGEVWGVSFADLGALKKQIKLDHNVAQSLWKSGVVDAQTLALMVADPMTLTSEEADEWLAQARADVLLGYLAQVVARTSFARDKLQRWTQSEDEFPRTAGYTLLCSLLAADQIPDEEARQYLNAIESTIRDSPNRARHAMNMALIAIGSNKAALKKEAIAAAGRIGKVEVDHGKTSCKTPDAAAYIRKASAKGRGRKRQAVC